MNTRGIGPVVDSFITGEGAAAVVELAVEIESVLGSELTEHDMVELWIDSWGASYDPRDDRQNMRDWLTAIHTRLSDGAR